MMAFGELCFSTLMVNVLLLSGSAAAASQQTVLKSKNGPFDVAFEKLANETLELWKVPGLSIAVVDGDDAWAEGYGIATFPSTPAEAKTLFYVGSTTKAFTAAAMSFLVDDNENYPQVQWNTPISHLIRDDFVLEDDYVTTHVTIEDAFSHRTGMPRHDMSYESHYDGHGVTPKDIVRSLRFLPLTAELRTKWQYCNMMYVTISHIIETLTKSWLGDVIRTQILEPLDMKSTYFSIAAARKGSEGFAQGYYYQNGSYHEVPDMNLTQVSGAGFIISNVLDYTKWIRAMIDQAPPISKAGHNALREGRTLKAREVGDSPYTGPSAYALGWDTGVYRDHEWYQHSGLMDAFGANVVFFPGIRFGLVAFGNTAAGSNSAEETLMWHLVDERLGVPEEERFDWNKKNQAAEEQKAAFYDNAKSHFYPSIPSPPIPLSLSLQSYTGTYFHPGYNNMTITLSHSSLYSPHLRIDRTDQTWKMRMDLEHISGEHFIAWADSLSAPGSIFKMAFPAEFRLGKDGRVMEFGARMEESMAEEKIWFVRV